MKLWLLRLVEFNDKNDDPWEPWYDKCFGFVIRAKTQQDARQIANVNAGDEKRWDANTATPWLDAKYSTCVELLPDGGKGVVIKDFASA